MLSVVVARGATGGGFGTLDRDQRGAGEDRGCALGWGCWGVDFWEPRGDGCYVMDGELTGCGCDGASGVVARGVGGLLEGRAWGERDDGSAYRDWGVGTGDGAVWERLLGGEVTGVSLALWGGWDGDWLWLR